MFNQAKTKLVGYVRKKISKRKLYCKEQNNSNQVVLNIKLQPLQTKIKQGLVKKVFLKNLNARSFDVV